MEKTTFLHKVRRFAPPPQYWPKWLLKKQLDRNFVNVFGHPINWKDPKTFSEKLQLYKIFYRDPILHRIVDKVTFKDYVREKLGEGHTAKLLAKWDRIEDVDLSVLTPPYVLKSNCSSLGNNLIIVNAPVSSEKVLIEKMRSWFDLRTTEIMDSNFAYWGLKPCAFAEEYIKDIGEGATDYKLFCFDGKVCYAYSAIEHFRDGMPRSSKLSFYDAEWNILDVSYRGYKTQPLPKPQHFSEMKEIAKKLSAGFPFVRVDFYDTPAGPLLGEMTFYSGSGLKPFEPESFDYELGKAFILPKST